MAKHAKAEGNSSVDIETKLTELESFPNLWKGNLPGGALSQFWWDTHDGSEQINLLKSMYVCACYVRDNIADLDPAKDRRTVKALLKAHKALYKMFFNYHSAILYDISSIGLRSCDIMIESVAFLINRCGEVIDKSSLVYSTNEKYVDACIKNGADLNTVKKYLISGREITPIEILYREFEVSKSLLYSIKESCPKKTKRSTGDFFDCADPYDCREFLQDRIDHFLDKLKVLITAGADINTEMDEGETLLFKNLPLAIMTYLLDSGADTNVTNEKGQTPLAVNGYGMEIPHKDRIKLLVKYGADINVTDAEGRTILSYAKDIETAELLIANGADVNALDVRGRSPIFYAGNNKELTQYLIDSGAEVNIIDKDGRTPIFSTTEPSILRKYKKLGLDINLADNDGKTFIFRDYLPSYLFSALKKLKVDFNHKDNEGRSKIYYIEDYQAKDLIDIGIDLTVEDEDGITPLMYWSSKDDSESKRIAKEIKKAVRKLKKDKNPKDEVFFTNKVSLPPKKTQLTQDYTSLYDIRNEDKPLILAALEFCNIFLQPHETPYSSADEPVEKVIAVLNNLPNPAPKGLSVTCTVFINDETDQEYASLDIDLDGAEITISQSPSTKLARKEIASLSWNVKPGAVNENNINAILELIENLKTPERLLRPGLYMEPAVAY